MFVSVRAFLMGFGQGKHVSKKKIVSPYLYKDEKTTVEDELGLNCFK